MPRIRPEGGLTGTYLDPTVASASGMWTMKDLERNRRQNSWPLDTGQADPYFNVTGLLIHADGTADANNNSFIDNSSTSNLPFTGTYSVYFNGTSDYLQSTAAATGLTFGTGDFTVEFWVQLTKKAAGDHIINIGSGAGATFVIGFNVSVNFELYANGASRIDSGINPNLGQWYHVALVRQSGSTKLYINGTQGGSTYADTNNYAVSANFPYIGVRDNFTQYLGGYLSNLRVVKGTAVYTANFTPPTSPLTAIANTTFLTCQSSTIVDNSTNAYTITQSGTPTVSQGNYPMALTLSGAPSQGTFSPFSVPAGYWSTYFSGNSTAKDYLTPSNITIGSGDFCVEAWTYLTANQASCIYCSTLRFTINTPTNVKVINNGVADIISSTAPTSLLGRWAHLAVTREGTNMRLFIDGVLANTVANSTTFAAGTTRIGAEAGSLIEPFAGYISNLRVVTNNPVYTSSFTPPQVPLTNITGTQLLACQSNRFVDMYTMNAITPTSNVMVSAISPFAPTSTYNASDEGGSYLFNSTNNDYARIATAQGSLGLSTGDWTVEGWVFYNSIASGGILLDFRTSGGGSSQVKPTLYLSASGTLTFYTGLTNRISGTVTSGQWTHFAICKASNSTRLYINGIQQSTAYADTSDYGTTAQFTIGAGGSTPSGYSAGYVSDIRVTKSALYTSNFTPPLAPLSPTSNTTLLLKGTNAGIIDQTGKVNVSTVSGARLTTTYSKFGGSSVAFNGSSDYLALTFTNAAAANPSSLALGYNDFTIEGWFYTNGSASTQCLFQINGLSTGFAGARLDLTTSNTLQLLLSTSGTAWAINYTAPGALNNGQWYHIALVRSGNNFIIYVDGIQKGVTQTNSSALTLGSGYNVIGAVVATTVTNFWNGYIDEFRITKYARYTSTFTPPTQSFLDR
jgi:hypothetical protein